MTYSMARQCLAYKIEQWEKDHPVRQIIHHSGDVDLADAFLVEVVLYENGSAHIVYMDRPGESFTYRESCRVRHDPPGDVTVALVCNDVEPYAEFCETIRSQARSLGMDVVVARREGVFDMSNARNESLRLCQTDHVLMLDVDVNLTAKMWEDIQRVWTTATHCGVLNLKDNARAGNGLYFGKRELLMANGYDERFRLFWGEDTEFLMNFSRVGIPPLMTFLDYDHRPHSRSATTPHVGTNDALFFKILRHGREFTA